MHFRTYIVSFLILFLATSVISPILWVNFNQVGQNYFGWEPVNATTKSIDVKKDTCLNFNSTKDICRSIYFEFELHYENKTQNVFVHLRHLHSTRGIEIAKKYAKHTSNIVYYHYSNNQYSIHFERPSLRSSLMAAICMTTLFVSISVIVAIYGFYASNGPKKGYISINHE